MWRGKSWRWEGADMDGQVEAGNVVRGSLGRGRGGGMKLKCVG